MALSPQTAAVFQARECPEEERQPAAERSATVPPAASSGTPSAAEVDPESDTMSTMIVLAVALIVAPARASSPGVMVRPLRRSSMPDSASPQRPLTDEVATGLALGPRRGLDRRPSSPDTEGSPPFGESQRVRSGAGP